MKRFILLLIITFFTIGCENPSTPTSMMTDTNSESVSEPGQLSVHYIDVGQGSASFLHFVDENEEWTILYDVGDWQNNEIVPYLEKQQIEKIDLIIVSHPHADHIGQLDKVIENFHVGEVWMSGNETDTQVFIQSTEAILEHDIDYAEPRAGELYDIGPLEITMLHPETLSGDLNEDSLAFRLTFGQTSFLFTGDTNKAEELEMVARTEQMEADILLVGHHGSDTSSDPAFIQAVNPDIAIYSAGENNSYGHPHREVIEFLQANNIHIYGTDIHGTIVVKTDGTNYHITTEKQSKKHEQHVESVPVENNETQDCIDINFASKNELIDIIHIGEARAEQLIELRPFETVADLIEIKGIGPNTLSDIQEEGKACVGGE